MHMHTILSIILTYTNGWVQLAFVFTNLTIFFIPFPNFLDYFSEFGIKLPLYVL